MAHPSCSPSLHLQALIASGEYSSVYAARRSGSNETIALKVYNRDRVRSSSECLRRALREKHAMEMLARMPHPFVTSYRFACSDDDHLYLGMEQVGGGDLLTILETKGPLAPKDARVYAGELCLALGTQSALSPLPHIPTLAIPALSHPLACPIAQDTCTRWTSCTAT